MKELKVKDDGFSELTKLLREKYAMNHRICQENTLTFSHLLDRVQMDNESVSDFGHKLIEIAKNRLKPHRRYPQRSIYLWHQQ